MSSAAQRKSLTHGQTSVQLNHPTQQHPSLANRQLAREEYFGATTSIPTHKLGLAQQDHSKLCLLQCNTIPPTCNYLASFSFRASGSITHIHSLAKLHHSHIYEIPGNCSMSFIKRVPTLANRPLVHPYSFGKTTSILTHILSLVNYSRLFTCIFCSVHP
jgi:hypothetical protein